MHMYSGLREHTPNKSSPHIRDTPTRHAQREICRFPRIRTPGNTVAVAPRKWNTFRWDGSTVADPLGRSIRRDCTEDWEFED